MDFLNNILPFIQIGLSVFLVGAILLQQSAAGIGGAFGGADGGGFHTRRGFEKVLFNSTIVLAILFGVSAFTALLI